MSKWGKFHLDKANGRVFGVCAGISEMTGWDVTLVRVATAVLALALPWTIVAYLVAALVAKDRRPAWQRDGFGPPARVTRSDVKAAMTGLDRRMAEVETYVATGNSSLEREIESLRS
ncbi:MAG: phage shock protein [Sphingomonadales bacterium]|jgi:phage shock protein C|nr:phage shock protein [Sphingomonadales bacterium]